MPDYDYDQLYPNRFIKGAEFRGKAVTLTIIDIAKEEFEDKKGKNGKALKVVLTFKETERQLLANKLNCTAIMLMFGRNTKDWRGKRVTFYPLKGEWFGRRREAVRVLGSPDIARDIREQVQLGREQQEFHLRKTAPARTAPVPTPEPEPLPDEPGADLDEGVDPVTGEVLEGPAPESL
jgi:hypothetical protein